MTEYQKLENMGSVYNQSSNCEVGELDDAKGLEHTSNKSDDSFVVDMERFSHLIEKDVTPNSRIKRNLSRKGSTGRGGGINKFNTTNGGDRDATVLTSSPRATLHGSSNTPEKPMVVALGAADQCSVPQVHHQITITNGGTAAAETKLGGRRYSFRRRSDSWAIDPRRILLFFATLSCIGTILLIYFTLTMSKSNEDDSALDE